MMETRGASKKISTRPAGLLAAPKCGDCRQVWLGGNHHKWPGLRACSVPIGIFALLAGFHQCC
jgi:hypothetical protein